MLGTTHDISNLVNRPPPEKSRKLSRCVQAVFLASFSQVVWRKSFHLTALAETMIRFSLGSYNQAEGPHFFAARDFSVRDTSNIG